LVIGLDGATLDLAGPWARAGKLPVLRSLMERGAYARLRSVLPVLSSAAWASFMTGTNPGKHGVFDFVRRAPGTYRLRPVSRLQIAEPSLWKLLGDQGQRVAALNVPMTYPPEPVNGVLVTGLGTPEFKPFTHPPDLGPRLLQAGYQINRRVFDHSPGHEQAHLQDTHSITRRVTEAALGLLAEEPWAFFMVVYRGPDEMAHAFWHHMDPAHPAHDPSASAPYASAILDYYRLVDEEVGRLLDAAGPEATVFIMSDHGSGPLYKDVYLNEWLRQQGYLAPAEAQAGAPRRLLARVGLTRSAASRILRGVGLRRLEQGIKDRLGDRIEWLPRERWGDLADAVDWSHSRAYSFGYHGQIYINVRGREPAGVVAPGAEYHALCDEITEALYALVDPADGRPVVSAVYRGDQVFRGGRMESAPDLIVMMRDLAYITRQGHEFGSQAGRVFVPPVTHQSGSHRLEGLLIAAGPGIQRAQGEQPEASIMDLAPTILHLLQCAVPEAMDGQVLRAWLAPAEAERPVQTYAAEGGAVDRDGQGLTDEEEAEIVERLRHLGYLG
jgi:predicted AlkP superfamily phosphohydrolase/phosphomutase